MKKLIIGILLLGFVTGLFSQTQQGGVNLVVVRYIHDGEMTYSYNLKGIQSHMEMINLIPEKRDIYQALTPIVEKMEKKKKTTNVFSVVLGSIGIGTAVTGGVIAANSEFPSSEFSIGFGMAGGGLLFGVLGASFPRLIGGVKDEDILKYINSYNTLNPDSPLKVY